MPLFKTIPIPKGLIGLWKFTETTADLLPHFSEDELADPTFRKYTHEKRKLEWLATRMLIRQLIGPDFTVSYLDSGKPILNHGQFKHISISHSGDFAAVILHEYLNVGIDVEETTRDFTRIEKRYLSDNELIQTDKNPKLKSLFWCAKEAIFKLVPEEGIDFRQQVEISLLNNEIENRFSAQFKSGNMVSVYQLHYHFFSSQCLAWVIENSTMQE